MNPFFLNLMDEKFPEGEVLKKNTVKIISWKITTQY